MERGQYFQSNRKTRVHLDTVAELLLKRGLLVTLRMTSLHAWVEALPPFDDELVVDCASVAAFDRMLVLMYGPLGGGGVLQRAGRAFFRDFVTHWADKLNLQWDVFGGMLATERARYLLEVLVANWALHCSRPIRLVADEDAKFMVHLASGLVCDESMVDCMPSCYATLGFLKEAVEWIGLGDSYQVNAYPGSIETGAGVTGDACIYEIIKYE